MGNLDVMGKVWERLSERLNEGLSEGLSSLIKGRMTGCIQTKFIIIQSKTRDKTESCNNMKTSRVLVLIILSLAI